MNKFLVLVTFAVLISACSPTPTLMASSPIPNQNTTTESSTAPAPITDTPAATLQPTALPVTSEPVGNLPLQVLSPLNETVVNTAQVDVTGTAPAGSVVSVNDEIIVVGDDGQFKATLSLEEGPNLIEVLASDANGNESSVLLTITYEP